MAENSPGMPQVGEEPEGKTRPSLYGPTTQPLRFAWRDTRMGGLTETIVVCLLCKKVLEPTSQYRSRRGTHGEDTYSHIIGHPLEWATLQRSNSGRRSLTYTDGFPRPALDLLHWQWITHGLYPDKKMLEQTLRE
ncbi:MAG: hypothetical protein QXE52_08305 [Candidatus Caldarchaeum sp.]